MLSRCICYTPHLDMVDAPGPVSINDDCPICLCEMITTKDIFTTPCNHKFHINCINMWKKKSTKCPMCRTHENDNSNNKLLLEIRSIISNSGINLPNAEEQLTAVERFTNGQMSYADMRSICG
jgi:Ring finger domain